MNLIRVSAIIFISLLFTTNMFIATKNNNEEDLREISFTISFSKPYLEDRILMLRETSDYYLHPLEPVLPVYIKVFTFPFGSKIKKISCQPLEVEKIDFFKNIRLCPIPYSPGFKTWFLEIPEMIHNIRYYPKDWYSFRIGTGVKNDEHILFLSLAIYPARYLNGGIQFLSKCRIKIEYEPPMKPMFFSDRYDLLIISNKSFIETLKPFVEFKNISNITTKLVSLDDIPPISRDRQEDIKYFIKNAVENWGVKYVLLVGSLDEMPCRKVYIAEARAIFMDQVSFISDLYYADIYDSNGNFSSWDSNGNNKFGEYKSWQGHPIDDVDLYPDVYLARIPCTNNEELNITIHKIIDYEKNSSNNNSWFKNIVLIGGDTFTEDISGIDEGEFITENIAGIMKNFSTEKIWGSNGKLLHAMNINEAINKGAGFVIFEGHAGANSYRTHPHKTRNQWIPVEWYRTYHIQALSNKNMLPIVTVDACNICRFSSNYTCFGWAFLSKPDGGSIGTIGMSSLSWIYPGRFCTKGLGGLIDLNCYKAYSQYKIETFGEMWSYSIEEYLNKHPWRMTAYDYKTIESWEPLGDPSLMFPSN